MGKFKLLALLGVCGVVLGACGDSGVSESEGTETHKVSSEVATSDSSSKKSNDSENYFKDNELVTKDVKIKITDTKVIPVGEKGNEYGEKPVIAFWYDVTNLSGEETDPSSAWILLMTAYQDNNENSLNELNMGSLPDDAFLDSQSEQIKEGGTVSNAVAYELDDDTTPVTLVASDMFGSDNIGKIDYEIK